MIAASCAMFCVLCASAGTLEKISEFERCLSAATYELDDFISPASDIASATAAKCRSSWQSVLLESNESLTKMDEYPSAAVRESALRTVLQSRREAIDRKSNTLRETKKPAKLM